mgnify:CR=1 FL=1
MTALEERNMHDLSVKLEQLTRGTGWEAMRYMAIASIMEQLSEYCATCDCKVKASRGVLFNEQLLDI